MKSPQTSPLIASGPSESESSQTDHALSDPGKSRGRIARLTTLIVILCCGTLAWWFGIEAPRRERVAQEVLSAARKTAETRHQINETLTKARASVARKQWRDGQAQFEEVLLLDPSSPEALLGIGKIREHLANARGGLIIKTDPPGAMVQVGGSAVERTPAAIKDLRLGQYPVKIELDGFEPFSTEFEVKENEFTDSGVIELVRGKGALKITSIPPGQAFELWDVLGKKTSGTTPAEINNLPTGTYLVKYSRVGWQAYETRVVVNRNETTALGHEFGIGELTIESVPPRGAISVNGVKYGLTPIKAELPVGQYVIVGSYPDCPDVKAVAKLESGNVSGVKVTFDMQAARELQEARESERQAQKAEEERAAMAAAEEQKQKEKARRRVVIEEKILNLQSHVAFLRRDAVTMRALAPTYDVDIGRMNLLFADGRDNKADECEVEIRKLQAQLAQGDY